MSQQISVHGKELKTVEELLEYVEASTSKYGIKMNRARRRARHA